jgi:hypothetical protein
VFNLGKEVKAGKVNIGGNNYVSNGRDMVPSLSKHFTKLLSTKKDWIIFQGKYTNETSPE